jgi:hypothetical protein
VHESSFSISFGMNLNLSHYLLHFQETYCPFVFTVALAFFTIRAKMTRILQYVASELRCPGWNSHQPDQRGGATKMEARRRKEYVAALFALWCSLLMSNSTG